jgi:hypothetical protein
MKILRFWLDISINLHTVNLKCYVLWLDKLIVFILINYFTITKSLCIGCVNMATTDDLHLISFIYVLYIC